MHYSCTRGKSIFAAKWPPLLNCLSLQTPEARKDKNEWWGRFFISSLKHQGVDFVNILRSHILYKNKLHSFSIITVRLCDFLMKGYGKKAPVKCWWNCSQGADFTNIFFRLFFTHRLKLFLHANGKQILFQFQQSLRLI